MKEGKTSYGLHLLARSGKGAIAWDPRHMIDEEMAERAGFEYLTTVDTGQDLEEAIQEYDPGELVVVRPSGLDLETEFHEIIGVLLDPPERFHDWALLVDEAASLQSAHAITPDLDRIVRQHPRSALIVQTTHSLQDWHRSSRDLTDAMVAFRLQGRSLDAFVEYADGSEDMRQAVLDLPRHYAILIDCGSEPGAEEFTYIEPQEWWNNKVLDKSFSEAYNGGEHGETGGAADKGNGQEERFVGEGSPRTPPEND